MPEGVLIAVVGPSGAGKDSLIAYARERLASEPSILFVRRIVTRSADTAAEDHASLTPAEFANAEAAGAFAVCWDAHGLRYGIPVSARDHVAGGGTAVVNGSRAALADIRAAFDHVVTLHVSARPEVLAARLAARGRESQPDILQRLRRAGIDMPRAGTVIEIDNSGALEGAGASMVDAIRNAAGGRHI